MKKALVPIFVFLISTGSQCIPAKESDIVQACKLYESLAEVIMEARQKGAPMSGLYTRDYGTKERNEITKKSLLRLMISPDLIQISPRKMLLGTLKMISSYFV
ncbi:hypothetical protein PY247_10660 [Acinetobacter proteolyticus]|nr:hypothetical protein [Acinetobacter proteolyticus]WEI20134.1 hypothetical protein PY247_10660 [Acinetobacter proteolyticus]